MEKIIHMTRFFYTKPLISFIVTLGCIIGMCFLLEESNNHKSWHDPYVYLGFALFFIIIVFGLYTLRLVLIRLTTNFS